MDSWLTASMYSGPVPRAGPRVGKPSGEARPTGRRGRASDVRPGVGELGEQAHQLGALGGGEIGERLGEVLPALSPEPPRDADAVVGQRDAGAAGIVGVGLAAHETGLDGLLDEARRPRLVHSDRLPHFADREGVGCRGQRLEQTHARRGRQARTAPPLASAGAPASAASAGPAGAAGAIRSATPAVAVIVAIATATAAAVTVAVVPVQPLMRGVTVSAGTEGAAGAERAAGAGRESPLI